MEDMCERYAGIVPYVVTPVQVVVSYMEDNSSWLCGRVAYSRWASLRVSAPVYTCTTMFNMHPWAALWRLLCHTWLAFVAFTVSLQSGHKSQPLSHPLRCSGWVCSSTEHFSRVDLRMLSLCRSVLVDQTEHARHVIARTAFGISILSWEMRRVPGLCPVVLEGRQYN